MKVTIPQPCHEDWNKMNPASQGRFCKACEKVVVDFTNKNPNEIKEILMNNTGNLCGRFKNTDLDRNLDTPVLPAAQVIKRSWFQTKWMALVAGITLMLAGKKTQAQDQEMVGQVMRLPVTEDEKLTVCKPSSTVIHGQIKSTDTLTGLSAVQVKVYSNGNEIVHEFIFDNGKYFLTVPAHTIWDFKVTIECNAAGFETKVLHDIPSVKDRIALDLVLVPLSDEVVKHLLPQVIDVESYTVGAYAIETVMAYPENTMGAPVYIEERLEYKPALEGKIRDTTYVAPEVTKVIVDFPDKFSIKSYPNPSSGIFNLAIENSEQSEIFVYDLQGSLVYTAKASSNLEVIDLRAYPNGTYVLKVVSLDQRKSKEVKLVKMS